jgi:DNA-binding FadR family transcriptional regulator
VPPGDRTPQRPSDRVETALRSRLQAGEWSPGERLPPVAALSAEYGVARSTVLSALRRLEADGLIEVVSNWGTFKT